MECTVFCTISNNGTWISNDILNTFYLLLSHGDCAEPEKTVENVDHTGTTSKTEENL